MVKGHSGVKGADVLTYFRLLWSVQPVNASNILILFPCRNFALAPFYSLWGSYGEKTASSAQIRSYQSWDLLKKLAHFELQHEVILLLTLCHLHFFIPFCFTEPLSLQFVCKCSLTLGTTLPRLLISYTALAHPHAPTHRTYLCTYSHTR